MKGQQMWDHSESSLLCFTCSVCPPSAGNRQELAGVLRYHLGEGMLVSGGVGSHTRVKPLQGEKLELGVVRPLPSPHFQ